MVRAVSVDDLEIATKDERIDLIKWAVPTRTKGFTPVPNRRRQRVSTIRSSTGIKFLMTMCSESSGKQTTISIVDTGKDRRSVTNDIEAVLRKIQSWHQGSITGFKIKYRDENGVWDGVR